MYSLPVFDLISSIYSLPVFDLISSIYSLPVFDLIRATPKYGIRSFSSCNAKMTMTNEAAMVTREALTVVQLTLDDHIMRCCLYCIPCAT